MKTTLTSFDWRLLAEQMPPPLFDPIKMLMDRILAAGKTACSKTDVAQLSELEKFAIAYFAGVPIEPSDMREPSFGLKLTTKPCGMYHDGVKWRVVMRSEDEIRLRSGTEAH